MNKKLCQTISFVYIKVIKFPNEQFSISNIVTKNVFLNVVNLLYANVYAHHSTSQAKYKATRIVFVIKK